MSAALDASAQALARRLLREHPATRPYARADLDALPGPVARLLAADLDGHVDRAAPATPWVDPADPAVREAARQWGEAARSAARIPADAWPDAVERAARRALAHLVRPAETLAAHAFEGHGGAMPASAAIRRLDAFGPYPYLPDIAARYVERKGLGQIDRSGLERLLRRIDQRMVSSFGAADWADLLAPLVDLIGPDGDPTGSVPAALVREIAEAKDAPALAAALDGAEPLAASDLRQRLADVLGEPPAISAPSDAPPDDPAAPVEASHAPTGDDAPLQTAPPDAAEPATSPVDPAAVPEGPPSVSAPPEEAEAHGLLPPLRAPEAPLTPSTEEPRPAPPLIGSHYRDPADEPTLDSDVIGEPRPAPPRSTSPSIIFPPDDDPASPPTAPSTDPPSPPAPAAPVGEDEPLWRRFARDPEVGPAHTASDTEDEAPIWRRFLQDAPAEPPDDDPASPPPDALGPLEGRVLGAGPDDRRDWFVDELFGGSADDYHRTLAALDDARTWTEATQIIGRDVFRKHSVNIYSEPAVAFTDAVEAQMTARGKG